MIIHADYDGPPFAPPSLAGSGCGCDACVRGTQTLGVFPTTSRLVPTNLVTTPDVRQAQVAPAAAGLSSVKPMYLIIGAALLAYLLFFRKSKTAS